MSVIVGLTGQSGAGKTTVSRGFMQCGFFPVNCDRLTRNIVDKDEETNRAVKEQFPDFFTEGKFDRRKAAGLLFSDRELLDRYNAAIFPHITRLINDVIEYAEKCGHGFILLDAPTLFESGADKMCRVIVSCTAPEEMRIARITARDRITEEQAKARIRSQHDEAFFRERSDYVINNSGDMISAETAAEKIALEIMNKYEKETN